jgi:GAF domain-containing protein
MELGPVGHGHLVASEAFERTARLVDRLAFATEADEVFAAVLDEGLAGLGAQSAGVFLLDDAHEQLFPIAHRNVPDLMLDLFPLRLDIQVPITDAARSGAPIWIDDRGQRDRWYPRLHNSPLAVRSSAVLPIPHGGRIIGVLALGFDREHRFAETERSFCTVLAALGGLAGGPMLKRQP